MKTKIELQKIEDEYDAFRNKLKELNEDELKAVTGGNNNITGVTYCLATNGNGEWKEDSNTITSITAISSVVPLAGENITYIDVLNITRTVQAVAHNGYSFKNCTFDLSTNTYTAIFN